MPDPVASTYDALARSALAEITDAANVGEWIEDRPHEAEDGAELVDVVYATAQPGYRGWSWIVTIAAVPGEEPTVLELGQLPGDDALLAPEWIPWSVRLAEWQAQQEAAGEAALEAPDGAAESAEHGDGDDEDEDDDTDGLGDDGLGDEDDAEDDLDDDDEDDDEDEFDEDGVRARIHGGDIDGVDIDDLDDTAADDDLDEDDDKD